jgi:hypothetical protein
LGVLESWDESSIYIITKTNQALGFNGFMKDKPLLSHKSQNEKSDSRFYSKDISESFKKSTSLRDDHKKAKTNLESLILYLKFPPIGLVKNHPFIHLLFKQIRFQKLNKMKFYQKIIC